MGDIADADVTLLGGDDLAGLHAAAALEQLAVEPGFLEVADAIGHEMRLIDAALRPDRSTRPCLGSAAPVRPAASVAPPAIIVSAERLLT